MLYFLLLLATVVFAAFVHGSTSDDYKWRESDDGVHRVAFGSCNNAERQGLWGSMLATRPHSLVLLGDNVYADRKQGLYKNYDFVFGSKFLPAREADFRRQYTLLAEDPQFRALLAHVGGMQGGDGHVRAVYDDHDYGVNNGDRTFENKAAAQRFFLDWLQVPADSARRQRSGVYNSRVFKVTLPVSSDAAAAACTEEQHAASACPAPAAHAQREGGRGVPFTYKVIMLDGRTHKDPKPGNRIAKKHAKDSERSQAFLRKGGATVADPAGFLGDFLGEEQWAWLARELLDPQPVDLILLGTGVQVLPEDKVLEETWQEFPHARRRLLNALHYARSVARRAPVVILSGDVHTAEVLTGSWDCNAGGGAGGGASGDAQAWADKLWEFTSSGLTHTFVKQTPVRDDITDVPAADSPAAAPAAAPTQSAVGGGGSAGNATSAGPNPIFTVMPALDVPSPQEAAEALARSLRDLEHVLVALLSPSPDSAVPHPPALNAAAESEAGTIWETAVALLEQLQTHAQEQVAEQGRLVTELLGELSTALSAAASTTSGDSGSAGGSSGFDASSADRPHGEAAAADDGWDRWMDAHTLDIRATAEAAMQVLENLSLPSAPDTTDEMAAASAIGEALLSLFEDAESFAGNALADGATYGHGDSDEGEDAGALAGSSAADISQAPAAGSAAACAGTASAYATYPFPHTQQLSRGKFYEQIYDAFVATGASQARQHTFADHYEGLHYGTVDVRAVGAGGRQSFQVEVTMVDHRNRPVMRRTLPPVLLQASTGAADSAGGTGSVADLMAHWDALPGEPLSSSSNSAASKSACDFVPFHGHTPPWRKIVAKWALVTVPLVGAVGPVLVLLYILLRVLWEALLWLWDNLMQVEMYMDLQMDGGEDEDQLLLKQQQQQLELLQLLQVQKVKYREEQLADDAAPTRSASLSPLKVMPVIEEGPDGEASPRSPRTRNSGSSSGASGGRGKSPQRK